MKLLPVTVTVEPTRPLEGVKDEMTGAGGSVTVNEVVLVAVPPVLVTVIGPLDAPEGTTKLICVALTTVKLTDRLLSVTEEVPEKFVPVTVTVTPGQPLSGLNPEIVGGGMMTVKEEELATVPPDAVTLIGPLVEPAGTVKVIWVALTTE